MNKSLLEKKLARLVVIDLETTGINPFESQVTAIAVTSLRQHSEPKVIYVRPPVVSWTNHARKYFAKYEVEWNQLAKTPPEACRELEDWLALEFEGQLALPVGHNVGFDTSFLRQLAHFAGKQQIANLSHRAIDTHSLLYALYLRGDISEDALSSDGAFHHFDIQLPDRLRHTAYGDVLATRSLLLRVLNQLLMAPARGERRHHATAAGHTINFPDWPE